MKLLIADDSAIIRMAIERSLASENVTIVGVAAHGKAAMDLFDAHAPDAVTMDITMPEMNGLECIERMMKARPEVKILVITALTTESVALQALKLGAKSVLTKPFTSDSLRASFLEMLSA